jgi:hypothetical protein
METDKKIYKILAVRLGAFLGGPMAVAYLMAANFKALGQPEKAGKAWLTGIAVSVVLFGFLFLLPEETVDKIPNVIISLFTMAAAHVLVTKYQQEELQEFLNEGGQSYSAWRAAGIALLMAILTLVVVVLVAVFIDSIFWGDSNGVKNLYHHR